MEEKTKGDLIVIGGHEDKQGDREILTEVARRAKRGPLLMITVATQQPKQMGEEYSKVFRELGVKQVEVLDIRTRGDASDEANVAKIKDATVIFFTGGDQLRITSQIGDTPTFRCLKERYRQGVTIVGTSAGRLPCPTPC